MAGARVQAKGSRRVQTADVESEGAENAGGRREIQGNHSRRRKMQNLSLNVSILQIAEKK